MAELRYLITPEEAKFIRVEFTRNFNESRGSSAAEARVSKACRDAQYTSTT